PELVVALDRPENRSASACAVEMVEPQVVPEEVRDAALERVEFRERVLAQAEEEVCPQPRLADRRRELRGKRVVLVVEEVLLELVGDDVDVAADGLRCRTKSLRERAYLLDSHGRVARRGQTAARITRRAR